MTVIAGIDASLTGLGFTWGPSDFDFNWRRVRALSFGYSLPETATTRQKLQRVAQIADDVCTHAGRVGVERVWIEGQLAMGGAYNVPVLCELIGVLRHELMKQCGIVAELAPQTSVRRLLLGWLPPKNRKLAVISSLKSQGILFDDGDQYDAAALFNWGLHELAAPCLTGLLGPKPAKAKRPTKRKARAHGRALPGLVAP
jgi:hypothetical protein